ncbi:hypothetical protein J1N35_005350 [Gossypium stocksii]|uniref:Uncharacterized protein n=1 Tax=Gossypium stocksii TaxID=47602 RepID=A0A9D3WFM2_9ROSI|nr:hypothetical protein J1N35_005350 [Gossypium stocksii]
MGRAMMGETMRNIKRDIMMMTTIVVETMVMRNHEMGSGDPTTQKRRGLVKDVLYRRNIDSIERSAMKTPSEMLVEHETDMKPVEISLELPPMGNCHSKDTMRVLREWVGEKVIGHSSKHVNITKSAFQGGLSVKWGIFGPRELARFKKLMEKPVRLKLRLSNDANMES